jgi:hypothetical protein
MLVLIQVSSMKTSLCGSRLACSERQRRRPRATPAQNVGAGLLKHEQRFFEAEPLAAQEQPYRIVRDLDALRRQFVLQTMQRQVRRLFDPLDNEGAIRIERRLAIATHLRGATEPVAR